MTSTSNNDFTFPYIDQLEFILFIEEDVPVRNGNGNGNDTRTCTSILLSFCKVTSKTYFILWENLKIHTWRFQWADEHQNWDHSSFFYTSEDISANWYDFYWPPPPLPPPSVNAPLYYSTITLWYMSPSSQVAPAREGSPAKNPGVPPLGSYCYFLSIFKLKFDSTEKLLKKLN